MLRIFITIAIIGLIELPRVKCFRFSVSRALSDIDALEKKNWCFVEVIENEDNVSVTFDIPLSISHSGIFIYFANEEKEILRVKLNETVQGKLYEIPYKIVKEMKGEKTTTIEKDNIRQVSGEFLKSWLPNNSSKISAAVECNDGTILNYYGLQNLDISIPDLMILEEFKNYNQN